MSQVNSNNSSQSFFDNLMKKFENSNPKEYFKSLDYEERKVVYNLLKEALKGHKIEQETPSMVDSERFTVLSNKLKSESTGFNNWDNFLHRMHIALASWSDDFISSDKLISAYNAVQAKKSITIIRKDNITDKDKIINLEDEVQAFTKLLQDDLDQGWIMAKSNIDFMCLSLKTDLELAKMSKGADNEIEKNNIEKNLIKFRDEWNAYKVENEDEKLSSKKLGALNGARKQVATWIENDTIAKGIGRSRPDLEIEKPYIYKLKANLELLDKGDPYDNEGNSLVDNIIEIQVALNVDKNLKELRRQTELAKEGRGTEKKESRTKAAMNKLWPEKSKDSKTL